MGTLAAAIHATVYRGGGDPTLVFDTSLLTGLDSKATFSTEATAGEAWTRDCYNRFRDTRGGEARFWGARRVENINGYFVNTDYARSEPLGGDTANTAVSNYTISASVVPVDDSSIPAQRMWRCSVTRTGGSAGFCSLYASVASLGTRSRLNYRGTYIVSAYIRVRSYSLNPSYACNISVALDTKNSSDVGVAYPSKNVYVITGTGSTDLPVGKWVRIYGIFTPTDLGGSTVDRTTVGVKVSINTADVGGTLDYDVTGIQLEEVSGNTWQGPSEYVRNVSVAESSTKVPGVLYFPTTLSGASTPSVLGNGYILTSLTTTPISAANLGGLVLERAETNLCRFGKTMTGGSWIAGHATITNNATAAPSGRTDANYLVENTDTSAHYNAYVAPGFAEGDYVVGSVYIKRTRSRNWCALTMTARTSADAVISDRTRYFDIVNKTVGTGVGTLAEVSADWHTSAIIEDCSDGWVRVAICCGPLPATTAKVVFWTLGATADGTTFYTGSNQDEYALWCPSIVKARTLTSPILTADAADVTRDATTLSYPSALSAAVNTVGSLEVSVSYPYRPWEANNALLDFMAVPTTGGFHDGLYASEQRIHDGTSSAVGSTHSAPTNRAIITTRGVWVSGVPHRVAARFSGSLYAGNASANFDGSMNATGALRIASGFTTTEDRIGTNGIRRIRLWKASKGNAWADSVPAT